MNGKQQSGECGKVLAQSSHGSTDSGKEQTNGCVEKDVGGVKPNGPHAKQEMVEPRMKVEDRDEVRLEFIVLI